MSGVLSGIRVLDFGRYIAGPFCGCVLAELGAEVIRIEKVDGSEDRFTTPVGDGLEKEGPVGAGFLHLNRGKLGLALEPTTPEGRELVRKLVATADVVIANLPIGTLRAMGIDYDSLKAIKSDIILAMSSTFGEDGPYAQRVGFDGIAQAMSGNMHLSGWEGKPIKSWVPYSDFGTALTTAVAIMAALMHRERTGEGQYVEGTLFATALTYNNASIIEEAVLKPGRVGTGNRGQTSAPADVFKCRDGAILVRVVGQPLFRRWAKLMGEEHWLTDSRFATDIDRGNHNEIISERMQAWCNDKSCAEATRILEEARIPTGQIYDVASVLSDPHVRDAGFFKNFSYPGMTKEYPVMARLFRMSKSVIGSRHRAPVLGEHTDQLLSEVGIGKAELEALRQKKVIR